MHVGTAVVFQNPGRMRPDHEVYRQELRLADLVEPLGYDSIWGVEHHFTDYTMCPDVLQFLSYMAGRTERINLGSMVVVLPWHDPLRVAEQVAMLDAMSGGSCQGRITTIEDRKSTLLNSRHQIISYAVFCLKKKKYKTDTI